MPTDHITKNELKMWDLVKNSNPRGCVLWEGALCNGYPWMKYRGVATSVRRVVYALFKHGFPAMPWPGGRASPLTTSCGNKRCVNPHHIEEK